MLMARWQASSCGMALPIRPIMRRGLLLGACHNSRASGDYCSHVPSCPSQRYMSYRACTWLPQSARCWQGSTSSTCTGVTAAPITYQFLDTFWNKRTDEYGGSFRRRARFWLETIERIKEAVGDRCAIAVRMSMDSLRPGGPGVEDTVSFMELADPLVDLWDMQVGSVNSEWGDDALASRFAPENFQRPWIEQVRPHTKKPIVGVGRFTSPDVMAEMVRTGYARPDRIRAGVDRRSVPAQENRDRASRRDQGMHRLQHLCEPGEPMRPLDLHAECHGRRGI
jgi:hypothetical protein